MRKKMKPQMHCSSFLRLVVKRKKFFFLILSFICCHSLVFAQQKITGKIVDEKSQPLPGATVAIKGGTKGVSANAEGIFSIQAEKGQVLEFTYLGKVAETVTVESHSIINITLKEQAASDLNEVVVIGYMTQKKADLTGAVSVVTTQELNKNHGTTNVLEALQGVVPGMHITTDGNPTGNFGMQIRGLSSLNSTASPLIVIDGVPSRMNLRDINADNIASLQVLKDAASATIYGAEGAAGVILIETKKGSVGKAKISYNGSFGVSAFLNKVDMLNTQQYGQALWQAAVNGGKNPNTETQIYDYEWHTDANGVAVLDRVIPLQYLSKDSTMLAANTDWLDEISQLGMQNNHQLTISGGNDKSTSLLSLNFFENRGTQMYTGYRRFSVRLNTEYKVINDLVKIGENLEFSNLKINDQNEMHNALVMPSIIPVHSTDGGWGGSAVALGMDDYWNPVRNLTQNKDNGTTYNKLYGDVHASVKFLKNFSLNSKLGLIYTDGYHRIIEFTFEEAGGKANTTSSVSQWYWKETMFDLANTLNYALNTGKHSIDIIAGMAANTYVTEFMDANRQAIEFENYDFAYLGAATGNISVSGGGNKYNALSYFSKANYVYNSKYLLSASLRYDGSSKFGKNNRYGAFPAVSAGWRLSEEDFFKDVEFLSDLKLRISWGKNGNSNIPTGATETVFVSDYNATSYAIDGSETGLLPSGYRKDHTGNPDLKWETTRQTNIGVDFGLFNHRLSGSLDLYDKYTYDMLFNPPYLAVLGEGANKWINAGSMTNKGAELQLTYRSAPGKNFTYMIRGNISHNKNEISDLPESVRYSYGGSALKGDDILGRPRDTHYGFITDGIFKSQDEVDNHAIQPGKGLGRIRYKDLSGPDGRPDGKIDYDYDRTWLGSWDPKAEYGIYLSANYKNFDFSMFWQGVAGNTVYNGWKTYSDFWNVWVQNGFNHPTRVLDAWSPANPNSNMPALSLNNTNDELRISTYLLESGSYLKLRNVQVGYNLPRQFTARTRMDKFYVYLLAENVLMLKKSHGSKAFTGPDPENPEGADYTNPYVRPQIFKMGVEISF